MTESAKRTRPSDVKRKPIEISQSVEVNTRLLTPECRLPLVITPAVAGLDVFIWLKKTRDWLATQVLTHGALLFRGFNVETLEDFEKFIGTLSSELLDYSYRSTPRTQLSGKIYSSTEYPAHQSIPLHNELAYAREWPMRLWFYCAEKAARGGETPIADSRRVYQRIPPQIRDEFERKQVMYVRNYGEGLDLSWQDVFQTTEESVVEQFCRLHDIEFKWQRDGRLTTRQVCQAVGTHPVTGDKVWFNQAHLFHVSSLSRDIRESLLAALDADHLPRNAFYGDGSAIADSVLDEIRDCYRHEAVEFEWQNRDILMVDNMLTAHGRNPYVGARKIAVGMAEQFSTNSEF
jgi:alpha-ketoglutarate-dependent taurine dioxygenase